MSPDEQLLYARLEIENPENAPLDSEDADNELYAPLFRNVSVFRR